MPSENTLHDKQALNELIESDANDAIETDDLSLEPGHYLINGFITSSPPRPKTLKECFNDYIYRVAFGS